MYRDIPESRWVIVKHFMIPRLTRATCAMWQSLTRGRHKLLWWERRGMSHAKRSLVICTAQRHLATSNNVFIITNHHTPARPTASSPLRVPVFDELSSHWSLRYSRLGIIMIWCGEKLTHRSNPVDSFVLWIQSRKNIFRCFRLLANVNSRSLCGRKTVCLSFVTFVRPTQPVEIFGNVSTPFGTLAIQWYLGKILRKSS